LVVALPLLSLKKHLQLAKVKFSSGSRAWRTAKAALGVARTQGLAALYQRICVSAAMYAGENRQERHVDLSFAVLDPAGRPTGCPVVDHFDRPLVSIIVPVFNNLSYTAACVEAVTQCAGKVSYEIIIADDGSEDGTAEWCHSVPNLQYAATGPRCGFVLNCNRSTERARGRWLLFLNYDTLVQPGFLEAMVAAATDAEVGAVGAKLIYPDGKLQEAGGIVWRDFEAWNYGRGGNPQAPAYNYRRRVDYCSGACLMVDREAFQTLGGFSSELAPAYGEDSDLCFSLREKLGLATVYEPAARVVHFEGKSCGTDLGSGLKRYQEVNKSKLAAKWRHVVADFPTISPEGLLRAPRRYMGKQTVLIIDSCLPAPDRDSGSRRLETIINLFRGLDCHVMFLPENLAAPEPYASRMRNAGVEVLACNPGYQATHRKILEPLLPIIDLVWMVRPEVTDLWLPFFRKHRPQTKLVFDTGDIHHLRMRQEEELLGGFRTGRSPSESMRILETKLAQAADATVAISDAEASLLRDMGARHVEVVSGIYRDKKQPEDPMFAERHGLLFIGSYMHPPNVDGMLWFLREVWPLILERDKDITLTLIGADPPQALREHASDRVVVAGHVPDVDRYFRQARVFICPLRYGGGVKGKLGQCLEYGLPFVTTPAGAEGMGFAHEVDALIASSPTDFADCVLHLYSDEKLWSALKSASDKQLLKYSEKSARQSLQSLLRQAVGPSGSRTATSVMETVTAG
jgi:GT2 family glycosyltransferase/glycosyltransferase involved in cell wall biosynthesis